MASSDLHRAVGELRRQVRERDEIIDELEEDNSEYEKQVAELLSQLDGAAVSEDSSALMSRLKQVEYEKEAEVKFWKTSVEQMEQRLLDLAQDRGINTDATAELTLALERSKRGLESARLEVDEKRRKLVEKEDECQTLLTKVSRLEREVKGCWEALSPHIERHSPRWNADTSLVNVLERIISELKRRVTYLEDEETDLQGKNSKMREEIIQSSVSLKTLTESSAMKNSVKEELSRRLRLVEAEKMRVSAEFERCQEELAQQKQQSGLLTDERDSLRKEVKRLLSELGRLESEMDSEFTRLKNQLNGKEKGIRDVSSRLDDVMTERENFAARLVQLNEKSTRQSGMIAGLEENNKHMKRELDEQRRERGEVEERCRHLKQENTRLKGECEKWKQASLKLQSENEEQEMTVREMGASVAELQEKLEEFVDISEESEEQKKTYSQGLKEANAALSKRMEELTVLRQENRELNEIIVDLRSEIESLQKKCEDMEEERHFHAQEHEEAVSTLEENVSALKQQAETLTQQKQKHDSLSDDVREAEINLKQFKEENEDIKSRLSSANAKVDDLSETVSFLTRQLQDAKSESSQKNQLLKRTNTEYVSAVKGAEERDTEYSTKIADLTVEKQQLIDELANKRSFILTLEEENTVLGKEKRSLKEELTRAQEGVTKWKNEHEMASRELDETLASMDPLYSQVKSFEEEIESAREIVVRCGSVVELLSHRRTSEEDSDEVDESVEKLMEEMRSLNLRDLLERICGYVDTAVNEKSQLEVELENMKPECEVLEMELQKTKSGSNASRMEMEKLVEQLDVCNKELSSCQKELSDVKKQKETFQKLLETNHAHHDNLVTEYDAVAKELEQVKLRLQCLEQGDDARLWTTASGGETGELDDDSSQTISNLTEKFRKLEVENERLRAKEEENVELSQRTEEVQQLLKTMEDRCTLLGNELNAAKQETADLTTQITMYVSRDKQKNASE